VIDSVGPAAIEFARYSCRLGAAKERLDLTEDHAQIDPLWRSRFCERALHCGN
jgi:hypothetical protein